MLRESKLLKDLSYTYFTVEKLNNKIKKQKVKPENASEELIDDFYAEIKLEFIDIEKEITSILNEQKYEISYPIENSLMYCNVIVDNIISGDDKDRIENLSSNKFHIEIYNEKDLTIINVHKKNNF
jgi:hypothetical protein